MNEFSIGATILGLRKGKGLTQEQLAGMIGVSAGAVKEFSLSFFLCKPIA